VLVAACTNLLWGRNILILLARGAAGGRRAKFAGQGAAIASQQELGDPRGSSKCSGCHLQAHACVGSVSDSFVRFVLLFIKRSAMI